MIKTKVVPVGSPEGLRIWCNHLMTLAGCIAHIVFDQKDNFEANFMQHIEYRNTLIFFDKISRLTASNTFEKVKTKNKVPIL